MSMITRKSSVVFKLVVSGVTWILGEHSVQLVVLYPVLDMGGVSRVGVPGEWEGIKPRKRLQNDIPNRNILNPKQFYDSVIGSKDTAILSWGMAKRLISEHWPSGRLPVVMMYIFRCIFLSWY